MQTGIGLEPPSGLLLRLEDLPTAVHAGLEIDVVGPAQLARILVLDIGRRRQRIGGAAHPAPRGRWFAFRNGHAVLSWSFGGVLRQPFAPPAFESPAFKGSRASMPGPRTDRAAFAIALIIWRFSRRTRAPPGPRRGPRRSARAGAPPAPAAWRCAAAGWAAPRPATPPRAGRASAPIC